MRESAVLSWSGGKDSALALARLQMDPAVRIAGLLTSITPAYDRVSIHGFRRSLLRRQAESLGLPLFEITLEPASSNDAYERAFADAVRQIQKEKPNVSAIAFGDIFLEDVRAYREAITSALGMQTRFPLWGEPTDELAREVLRLGIAARVVCVDTTVLPGGFAGRAYDADLLRDLPAAVDPCGERGEFHTFVFAGPGFRAPISHTVGQVVLRENRFAYCDLIDVQPGAC